MCPFILEMSEVYPVKLSNDKFNDHSSMFTNDLISYLYLLNNIPNRFPTHDNNSLEQLVYRYKTQYIEKHIKELTPLPDFLKKSFKRGIENEISMNRYSYCNEIITNTLNKELDEDIDLNSTITESKIPNRTIQNSNRKRKFDSIYENNLNDETIDQFLNNDEKDNFDFEDTSFCKKNFTIKAPKGSETLFPNRKLYTNVSFEQKDPLNQFEKRNELLYISKKNDAIASLNKTIQYTNEQLNNVLMGKINPDFNMVEELKKVIENTNESIKYWSSENKKDEDISGVSDSESSIPTPKGLRSGNLVLHPCISNFINENYNDLLIVCNVEQLNELRWNFILDCIELYPLELRNTREYKRVLRNLLTLRYSFPVILDHKRIKNILLNTVDYHLNNNGHFLSSLISTLFCDSYQ